MSGLLLKDMFVITKQLKFFLIMLPVLMMAGGDEMVLFITLICSTFPMTALAYDEQSKWDKLAIMMPYSKKDIVVSKYIFGYILIILAFVVSSLISGLVGIATTGVFSINTSSSYIYLSLGSVFIFNGLIMLSFFKFGVEKGRYIFIGIVALFGAIIGYIEEMYGNNIFEMLQESPIVLFFLFGLCINVVTMAISIKVKKF